MSLILSLFSPSYILDINWITRLHTLYFVWCTKRNKKFVVLQHGSYVAGLITDIPHRYIKANLFLVWSGYFKNLIEHYNHGKKAQVKVFGNTVYNQYRRDDFSYTNRKGDKVLVVPSLIMGERLNEYNSLVEKLQQLGFAVTVKEHLYQGKRSEPIKASKKIGGDLFSILKKQEYDIIITDVSSAMNDIIFFKSNVIFFSPAGKENFFTENVYSMYLKNLALEIDKLVEKSFLYNYVDNGAQEKLLLQLAEPGNNILLNNL